MTILLINFMPTYLEDIEIWKILWPPLVLSFLVSFILILVLPFFDPTKNKNNSSYNKKIHTAFQTAFVLIFSLSLFGIITGQIMGHSREPAVNAVIPAVLSLMSGAILFGFSKTEQNERPILGLALTAFVFMLFVGTNWGSRLRYDFEQKEYYWTEKAKLEAEFDLVLQKCINEKEIQNALRLPEKDITDMDCWKKTK